MQQPTIDRSCEGDGRPVQEQKGGSRQMLALGDGGRQQNCQRSYNGRGRQMWMVDEQQQETTQQPTIIGSIKSGQRLVTRVVGND